MHVRKAKPNDAEGIAKLYLQFWEVHKGVDPVIRLKKKPTIETEAEFAKQIIRKKSSIVLVAETEEQIIGMAEVKIQKNDECFRVKKYAWLNACVVDKNHRRKGVAKKLTEEAIRETKKKNIKYMKIKTYNDNKTALEAWKRLGFEEISTELFKEI